MNVPGTGTECTSTYEYITSTTQYEMRVRFAAPGRSHITLLVDLSTCTIDETLFVVAEAGHIPTTIVDLE